MQGYSLHIKASAAKELDAIDTVYFERIKKKIVALASNPRPAGSKKLKGHKDYSRIRIGDFRVIYTIDDVHRRIEIIRIAHRKEVYD